MLRILSNKKRTNIDKGRIQLNFAFYNNKKKHLLKVVKSPLKSENKGRQPFSLLFIRKNLIKFVWSATNQKKKNNKRILKENSL